MIVLVIVGSSAEVAAPPKKITIVDSAGKYVEIQYPLENIVVLPDHSASIICALGAKDKIVGIGTFARRFLGGLFRDLPDCGRPWRPYYETIITLKPQIVITYAKWPSEEEVKGKLEKFGIKVVRLDCYRLEKLFDEVKTLGSILGRQSEAERLINFYKDSLKFIENRVKDLPIGDRVRVYLEYRRPLESCGPGSLLHEVTVKAGGINLMAHSSVSIPLVSSEWVVESNPNVIVKRVSSIWIPDGGYMLTDVQPLEKVWNKVVKREGWARIEAVKRGRVHLLAWDLVAGITLPVCVGYLAKIFYPEIFEDFDPSITHKTVLKDFLGVEYKGIFAYP
jgi:iron complex transport system substrate-binding protein